MVSKGKPPPYLTVADARSKAAINSLVSSCLFALTPIMCGSLCLVKLLLGPCHFLFG